MSLRVGFESVYPHPTTSPTSQLPAQMSTAMPPLPLEKLLLAA